MQGSYDSNKQRRGRKKFWVHETSIRRDDKVQGIAPDLASMVEQRSDNSECGPAQPRHLGAT